jgi:hypothetical protein
VFSGDKPSIEMPIIGFGTSEFYNLEINKESNGIELLKDIKVTNSINFIKGNLVLIEGNINLDGGSLINENENSKIDGSQGGGSLNVSASIAPNVAKNVGGLGLSISSPNTLNNVSVNRQHYSESINGNPSINRSYGLQTTSNKSVNQKNTNIEIQFTYLDSELNGLNESDLVLVQINDDFSFTKLETKNSDSESNIIIADAEYKNSTLTLVEASQLSTQNYLVEKDVFRRIISDSKNSKIEINFIDSFLWKGKYIQIFNTLGQLLKSEKITSQNYIINNFNTKKGIYYLQLRNENSTIITKSILYN